MKIKQVETTFSVNKILLYKSLDVNFALIMASLPQSHIFRLEDTYLTSLIHMRNVHSLLSVKRNITLWVPHYKCKIKDTKILLTTITWNKKKKLAKLNNLPKDWAKLRFSFFCKYFSVQNILLSKGFNSLIH